MFEGEAGIGGVVELNAFELGHGVADFAVEVHFFMRHVLCRGACKQCYE